MCKQIHFKEFLSNIEPSSSTIEEVSRIQNTLRDFLKKNYENYIDSFLSGSYAKKTCIRPTTKYPSKRDVDIVVITNFNKTDSPNDVLCQLFKIFKKTRKYSDVVLQDHSIGITMNKLKIDVVPVLVDQKDDELFYIADSNSDEWYKTDPKGHIKWSTEFNSSNKGLYKPLVKIFKWWRQGKCPKTMKFPKGITLEKIIADNIDIIADNIDRSSRTIEDVLVNTMLNIVESYKDFIDRHELPVIRDPSQKVKSNNLLYGYEFNDFSRFIEAIEKDLSVLYNDMDDFDEHGFSNESWQTILGPEFPSANT